MDASKTGWTPNKTGNQRYTFTAVCLTYSLIVLSKRPFSLKQVARQSNWSVAIRDCVVTQCTQQNIPYQRDFFINFGFSVFDHTWAVFRSHYAWHLLMLVIICTKCRKNPLTTVTHSFNKFVANLITSTTRTSRNSKAFKKCSFICCNRYSVKQVFYC